MSDEFTLTGYSKHGASHPNPAYDFLTGFAPRKLRDLFRWTEYLFFNSPAIFAAVQKFASYTVTTLKVTCEKPALKDSWEGFLKNDLDVKGVSIRTGIDRRVYGNSFISVYKPFNRFLICQACKKRTGIKHVTYTFQLKTLKFKYVCEACKKNTVGTILDEKSKDKSNVAIIRWDPKLMDIDYNPITGKSKYYYTIPGELQTKVEKGNKHIIDSMPMEFLLAIRDKKSFGFADGQIYHMKTPSPAGIDAQWGLPPLTSTIKLFFYTAVLRKANEAIALDHLVPFRVLHPAPISGTADPASMVNLANWQAKLEDSLKLWRRDPNHIMMAPTALGVTMMGGQGRTLMTTAEIRDAEGSIIMAMGVPREFLEGGLTVTGSAISLRMLENQLDTDATELNDQLEWIIDQTAAITGWEPVQASFVPFRFVDDAEQKQLTMQLHQLLGGPLSKDTLLTMTNASLDLDRERKKALEEQIADARSNMELQKKMQLIQNSAAQQAQAEAQNGQGLGYNAQAVIAQADQLVQQFTGMDPGTRRSQMDHLSQEDPVMYAVVKDRMETNAQMMQQQATQQAKQQNGMQ